jgi:hypothetical protein
MSAATSFYTTFQQLTLTLGISVAATALSVSQALHHHAGVTLSDFSSAFVAIGLVSILAIPSAYRLRADAGAELSGHRARAD